MKQPVLALINVAAWIWLAVSVIRWLEYLAGIVGVTLRNTLGF